MKCELLSLIWVQANVRQQWREYQIPNMSQAAYYGFFDTTKEPVNKNKQVNEYHNINLKDY